jgi:hypothetical protein
MHCAARLSQDGKITSASLLILFPVKPFTRTSLSWFLACDDMPRFLSCLRPSPSHGSPHQTYRVEMWRDGLGSAYLYPALSSAGASCCRAVGSSTLSVQLKAEVCCYQ